MKLSFPERFLILFGILLVIAGITMISYPEEINLSYLATRGNLSPATSLHVDKENSTYMGLLILGVGGALIYGIIHFARYNHR